MKSYIAILLFVLPLGSFTQNYQNICSQGISYYKNPGNYLGAFRRDSVYITGVGDTIFISYTVLRDPADSGCADISNGSVLGRKIFKRHDGWIFFFNKYNDTIRINTQATLNQTWKLTEWSNHYLEATVISITQDSILGQTDQVKVISLQAKNSHAVNISSPFNQKQFRLSEHYGLSLLCDVYKTPYDTSTFSLVGKSNPQLGIQDLTWKRAFDFDTGDVFHFYYCEKNNYYGQWILWKQQWSIKRIIEKTVYGNYDSVVYHTEYCIKTATLQDNGNWGYTYSFDTLVQHYDLTKPVGPVDISRLPLELVDNHWITCRYKGYIKYNNRPGKNILSNAYTWNAGCYYNTPFITWEGNWLSYAEGLGQVDYCFLGEMAWGETNLVYFKKGSETWGTPVSIDCNTLVGMEPTRVHENQNISINPNPVEQYAEVVIPDLGRAKSVFLILYNEFGKQVKKERITASPFILTRANLPPGLYLLSVITEDGTLKGSSKVLFR